MTRPEVPGPPGSTLASPSSAHSPVLSCESIQVNTANALARFITSIQFDDLPAQVVHETKRIVLDVIGCGLGAREVAKGRIAAQYAGACGGPPEASVLGASTRIGIGSAAFANAELMHGLDFCPLLPPGHIAPFVTAPPLAAAQARASSGRTLLLALALAYEVSSRVGASLDPMRSKVAGQVARSWGLGFNTFGAAAGVGKILGLDESQMNDALGLAAYLSPVPSHNKSLTTTAGGGMAKYGPAGWTAQAGVTAAMLASMGYEGDRSVLDGDYGYWAMAGSEQCRFERMTDGLGLDWRLLRVLYKSFPVAGHFQSPLGAFADLIGEQSLKPDEIEHVKVFNEAQGLLPRFKTGIRNHVDTQNSLEYGIAAVAHHMPPGPVWQSDLAMNHPGLKQLMGRVSIQSYPRSEQTRVQELEVEGLPYIDRRPCVVEVTARGRVYRREAEYGRWLSLSQSAFRATDADLAAKFCANVAGVLSPAKAQSAIDLIMGLDHVEDVNALMSALLSDTAP